MSGVSYSEFGLEDWEKMFVRQWAAGHKIMGRLVEHDWYEEEEGSDE